MNFPAGRKERALFAGISLLLLGLLVNVILASTNRNDLDIFLAASRDLLAGEDVYTKKYFDWYSFFYSPLFGLLISPLQLLGPVGAKLLWGVLTIVAVVRCWSIVRKDHLPATLDPAQRGAIAFFVLLVLFQAVRDNINASQVTAIVLWLAIEGLHRIRRGQVTAGALLIAVGIDMKLIPLVLLPYLLYRREWKGFALAAAFTALLLFLPALVLGWQHNLDLLGSRWALIDPTSARHVLDEEEPSFQSLGSMLSAFLSTEGGGPNTLDLPRTVLALHARAIGSLLLLGRLLFIALALWFLELPPFRPARDRLHAWWETSYLLLCSALIFPHQQHYALLLAAPAVAWICFHTVARGGRPVGWLLLCTLSYLLLNAFLLAGEFTRELWHYKVPGFAVLLLIAMLAWCTPAKARGYLASH